MGLLGNRTAGAKRSRIYPPHNTTQEYPKRCGQGVRKEYSAGKSRCYVEAQKWCYGKDGESTEPKSRQYAEEDSNRNTECDLVRRGMQQQEPFDGGPGPRQKPSGD